MGLEIYWSRASPQLFLAVPHKSPFPLNCVFHLSFWLSLTSEDGRTQVQGVMFWGSLLRKKKETTNKSLIGEILECQGEEEKEVEGLGDWKSSQVVRCSSGLMSLTQLRFLDLEHHIQKTECSQERFSICLGFNEGYAPSVSQEMGVTWEGQYYWHLLSPLGLVWALLLPPGVCWVDVKVRAWPFRV